MDLARAPRRRPLTARKKGSGYENGHAQSFDSSHFWFAGRHYQVNKRDVVCFSKNR